MLQTPRPVYRQWFIPSKNPGGEKEVGIPCGVIGMEVSEKGSFEIWEFQSGDPLLEYCGCPSYNTRPEVYEVRSLVHNDSY